MNWEKVKLLEICDFQGGTQPPKSEWSTEYKEGYVRMLQIRDFTQGKDSFVEYVKDNRKLKKCNSDDILVGRYGASIGKILTGLSGAYNVALVKTVPTARIHKKFLYYYLLSATFQNFIQNAGSRAAQAGFNKEELEQLEIPLPPLHIQEQIADTLDKADALRKKDQELLKKYDELAQSIFYDMFGDPETNPKGWRKYQLKEITDCITKGESPNWQGYEYQKTGVLFVTSENVGQGKMIFEGKTKYIPYAFHEKLRRSQLSDGDVLMNLVGASIGRCSVFINNYQDANINQAVALIRCSKNKVIPEFISYLFRTDYMQRVIKGGIVESARANISLGDINNYSVIMPPLELQTIFHERIKLCMNQASKVFNSPTLFDVLLNVSF